MGFEFGTFIADAAGKLHDVSKTAFDTFGMKHQGKFRPGFGDLMEGGFLDGAKKILKKAGVSSNDLESWGGSGVSSAAKQIGGVLGGEAAAAGAGAAVGGPLGAALGIAVESGELLYKLFKKKAPAVFYQEGQWIAIDNGDTVVTLGRKNALEREWDDVDRRRLVDQGLDAGVYERQSMSIGFVLGPGTDPGTVTVFNCLKLRDETKNMDDVRPLDKGHAVAMDNNDVWSEIRLLRFEEEVAQQLNTDVVTDPGVEVLKEGVKFFVVRSIGNNVLIEHPSTHALHWTTVDELTPGRRVHNNTWNYTEGTAEPVAGSFASGQKATLAQGDWIWVPARSSIAAKHPTVWRQLGCIEMLEGSNVKAFYAVDGERFTIGQNDTGLRPVSDGLNEFIGANYECAIFKDAVVRGWDTRRLAVGKKAELTLMTLGTTPLDNKTEPRKDWRTNLHKLYHQKREEKRKADIPIDAVGTAGDQGLAEDLDTAEEAAVFSGERVTVTTAEVLSAEPFEAGEPPKSNSLVMFGLAAGAGLLFFLR